MPKKILLEDLKIGMRFSLPLYTGDNNTLIQAGVPIKESDYKRLVRWGIKELYTEGELIDTIEIPDENLKEKGDIDLTDENIGEPLIEEEYIKLYNLCISMYKDFINEYNKSERFDRSKLLFISKKIIEIVNQNKNNIIGYLSSEKYNYEYLINTAINTTILAVICAKQLAMDDREIDLLCTAGLLHDIGMFKVPKEVLDKKIKLSEEEFNQIKVHSISAFKSMSKAGIFNQAVLDAVLQHHEQVDGNGYPRKIKGEKINLTAKIISIADTFEAQICQRAYKKTIAGYFAIKSVLAEAQNKFDPKILRAFVTSLSIYPPGTLLQLNDNSIATVVSVKPDTPLRPTVKILIDQFGDKVEKNIQRDLKEDVNLFIIKVLNKDEYLK